MLSVGEGVPSLGDKVGSGVGLKLVSKTRMYSLRRVGTVGWGQATGLSKVMRQDTVLMKDIGVIVVITNHRHSNR